jgi:glucan biosynthesis protein C
MPVATKPPLSTPCSACGVDTPKRSFCIHCGGELNRRYHGLDGLRAFAMLLGIALHGSIPYFSHLLEFADFWPADGNQSWLLFFVFHFIHAWRMPIFFMLAGFFANLVLDRRGTRHFIKDRGVRIGLPLISFAPVIAILMPLIWSYGLTGHFTESIGFTSDIHSEFLAHLWFLYYLCLLYPCLIAVRAIHTYVPYRDLIKRAFLSVMYTRVPIALFILACFLFAIREQSGEGKPIWPLNIPDITYLALFFFYGYGLYSRRVVINRLQNPMLLLGLFSIALFGYVANIASLATLDTGPSTKAEMLYLVSYTALNIGCCLGFIGLFEMLFKSYHPLTRWIADSSYWVYLMHMPVVAFTTFFLARNLVAPAEMKFFIACFVTSAIGFITYKYIIRTTPIGWMLAGKRS